MNKLQRRRTRNVVVHSKKTIEKIIKPFQIAYSLPEKWFYSQGIYSTEALCLPDFLGIGTPQSGTSWLFENLKHHPDLYLSIPKELYYFDQRFHHSLQYYANKFEPGFKKVKGEITPSYSILKPERIQFIYQIMPDVKLILLLRNPIDRAWSAARRVFSRVVKKNQIEFSSIEDTEIFNYLKSEWAYRAKERGTDGAYVPGLKMGDYSKIIDNWLSVFPSKQLHIAFFDDITNCPQRLLSEIFAHLGISQTVNWDTFPFKRIINKNPKVTIAKKFEDFLREMYCSDIEMLYQRFGDPIASWRC